MEYKITIYLKAGSGVSSFELKGYKTEDDAITSARIMSNQSIYNEGDKTVYPKNRVDRVVISPA